MRMSQLRRRRWERGGGTMKVLVLEDDAETAAYVLRGLREHVVDHAADGREGLLMAGSGDYEVLVVDRMLPGLDGLGVVRTLRGAGVRAPVLFLTAVRGVGDRVQGLEAGGDDYLVKPFAFAELMARLNALARRPPLSDTPTALRVADLEMDLLKRIVRHGGETVELQPREFCLLEFLMRHADRLAGTLNRMLARIGVLMDSLRQVSSDVAHDLRTPLSRLRQRLEGALTSAGSVAEYQAAVEAAVAEAESCWRPFPHCCASRRSRVARRVPGSATWT